MVNYSTCITKPGDLKQLVCKAKTLIIFLALLGAWSLPASAQCDTNYVPSTDCGSYGDAIDDFTFAGVNSPNYGCGSYSTGVSTYDFNSGGYRAVTKGKTYSFTIVNGGGVYNEGAAIWIDYNSDGVYDPSELAWASTGFYQTHTGNITIPASATSGTVRMRVRCGYYWIYADYDACETAMTWGETEDYLLEIKDPPPFDAGVSQKIAPITGCGANDSVRVTLTNFGTTTMTSCQVTAEITGTIGGSAISPITLTRTFNGSVPFSGSVSFGIGALNTTAGANIQVKAWTSLGSDADATNDTILWSSVIIPPATTPSIPTVKSCGNGPATLTATSSAGTTFAWYKNSNGMVIDGYGSPYLTGPLTVNGSPYTYYGQAFKNISSDALDVPFNNTYGYYGINTDKGIFFNLTTYNDVTIDSFDIMISGAVLETVDADVYVRTGTYRGYETNPGAWTYVGRSTVTNTFSASDYLRLNVGKLSLNANQVYGFYIVVRNMSDNNTIIGYESPSTHASSGLELTVDFAQNGALACGNFGSVFVDQGFQFQGTIYYRSVCRTSLVSTTVNVVPRPFGASMSQGTPFKGFYRAGSLGSPDYTVANDVGVAYTIQAPAGFTNAAYGTTWDITSVSVNTVKGTPFTRFQYTQPSGGNPGTIHLDPNTDFIDSILKVNITVRNLNPANLCDSVITRHIHVTPLPSVNFTVDPVCKGGRSVFTNLSSTLSGTLTYMWDFGDGAGTSTFINPEYVYGTHNTYNVKLTATSSYGFSRDTTISTTVFEIPNINFTKVNACEGDSITFTNNTTIGTGTINYVWDFGDGTTSTRTNPKHLYSIVGDYDVTLTASANGCESVQTRKVYQFPRPVPSFSTYNLECNSTEAQLTSTSTIKSGTIGYVWDFGDGTKGTIANPTHTYSTYGNKTIKLKVISEFGCADSTSQSILLKEAPQVDFITSETCANDPVDFTNNTTEPSGAVVLYTWYFGDGDSSTLYAPSHKYNTLGNKVVKLVAMASNNCTSSLEKTINVKVQPVADFAANDVCSGEEVKFSNKTTSPLGSVVKYKWYFGDGNVSTTNAPKHIFNTSTTQNFEASLVATIDGGCKDSVSRQVKVYALPNCNFTIQNTGNRRYVFTPAVQSGLTYQWLFGDGSGAVNTVPVYQYTSLGSYQVTLVATSIDGNCTCSRTQEISVNTSVASIKKGVAINVYPNPNKGEFTVSVEGNLAKALKIEVYNILGEKIRTVDTNGSLNGTFNIDLNDSDNGIYLVRVDNGKDVTALKVTINR